MPAKKLLFGEEARAALFKGESQLAKAVTATLGPKGRNAALARTYGSPTVTKDGVTVAREIELEDAFENMGAQLVKEAAEKTNSTAGDGTTTATVLAHAMIEKGMKHLGAGKNAILIKRGMEAAVVEAVRYLDSIKSDVNTKEQYAAVATISAQDKDIGEVIAEVIDHVGKDGVVTVEAGQTLGLEKEFVEGMQFDQGYISPYFVTDPAKMEVLHENAYILITDQKVSLATDLIPAIEIVAQAGGKNLVIIAEGVDGDALTTMVVNKMRGIFPTVGVKAPAFGDRRKEILKDIAALTGGRVISEEIGLKLSAVTLADLGMARSVHITKDSTTIIDGKGEKADVETRIEEIKSLIETSKSEYDKEKLKERLAKLTGGVAVVKVGAATEVEQKERQHRVEDALSATKAAVEEGIVVGGGSALLGASRSLEALKGATEDEQIGIDIVREALKSPISSIAQNSGDNAQEVITQVLNGLITNSNFGYNALTGKYGDLVVEMVIDPKKVTRSALENACSVASMFLTLEVAVVDIPKQKDGVIREPSDMGM